METIRGKTTYALDWNGLTDRLANYQRVILDLGTGDGRYVRFLADRNPQWFVIGVDSCRENLREYSRLNLQNAIFVIASAQELPREFSGLISHITINFPWGSLLTSLLEGDAAFLNGLSSIAKQNVEIDILLNSGALTEVGRNLDSGTQIIYENFTQYGWNLKRPNRLDNHELCKVPTTWAKRLAFGRDPRAMAISGKLVK